MQKSTPAVPNSFLIDSPPDAHLIIYPPIPTITTDVSLMRPAGSKLPFSASLTCIASVITVKPVTPRLGDRLDFGIRGNAMPVTIT